MRSQQTQANRVSRTNSRTNSRPNPKQKVDPRRHRRQPPKPLEVVAVVILLSLIGVLGFILISGFIASLNPSSVAASSPTQNPLAALPTATPFQPGEGGEQANLSSEGDQTGEVLPSPTPTEDILENLKVRSIFCSWGRIFDQTMAASAPMSSCGFH